MSPKWRRLLDTRHHFSYRPTNQISPKRTPPGDAGRQGRGGSRGRCCHLRSRAGLGKRPAGMTTGLRLSRWTGTGPSQVTPDEAASQEARSGPERRRWFAAASAVVERRQASAPAAAGWRKPTLRGANRTRWCGHATLRLSAFRFLFFFVCSPDGTK
jgi:hypothetical protein